MGDDLKERLRNDVCLFSQLDWQEHVALAREAADRIAELEAEVSEARTILAHTDIGSLPNDWTLKAVAEARIDDLMKLRDQVRDTCRRAERAEAEVELKLDVRDVIAWADGIQGALGSEHANTVTEVEACIAQAVLNAAIPFTGGTDAG